VGAGTLGPGQAVRIFTGASVPAGADAVVIQENTTEDGPFIRVLDGTARPGANIRRAGLDFAAGDRLLVAGRRLRAAEIGLAAAMNLATLPLRRRPRVAILSTGDELALPGDTTGLDRVVAANGFALAAAGYFLVGFGPMLWLICQTTVRQLVTPFSLMGRVNATVQTAIYGVRPLGALAGGFLAAEAGLQSALLLIAVAFALSTLVIVLSPLARLRAMPVLAGAD